ncbi:MAG: GNAT family N-acetyltransferase, partial [Nitrospirota bacterium]
GYSIPMPPRSNHRTPKRPRYRKWRRRREAEGTVVGPVRFWAVAGVCIIRLLSVSPSHQGHGAAKALLREIERVVTDAHKFFACTIIGGQGEALRCAYKITHFESIHLRPCVCL